MNFAFTEEQQMLRDSVRSFLAAKVPSDKVREIMESESGHDDAIWTEMAQLGWLSMHIPEEYGGAGFSFLELGVVLEEMGRAVTPGPFFSSAVLGAGALLLGGSEEQKKELLPAIASGETIATLAVVEASGRWDADGVQLTAKQDGDTITLSGTKSFVLDGHVADLLIVAARDGSGLVDLYAVDAGLPGIERRRLETMDMTRKQAEVVFDDVRIPADARLGEAGTGAATLTHLYDYAAAALAFEQVGGAQQCLDMSVEYAKVRIQFGRPIGSFQAIKHKCADMLVQVESAKSAAYYAGWAASEDNEELRIVAPLAKSYCSDAFFFCASESIQVHGGIGFTWEHNAHLYFKRAKTDQLLFGDSSYWRSILADRLDL
jgi:alkylation response protein AidB-like acyl-CoA dehydrogenase